MEKYITYPNQNDERNKWMKRKWIVFLCLLFVIIGGKLYMDNRTAQKEADLIEAERMSVIALKNTFQDIKKVKFEKSRYDKKTGIYTMFIELVSMQGDAVNFSYDFWREGKEIGPYALINEQIQLEGVTVDEIEVEYSNGEKEQF